MAKTNKRDSFYSFFLNPKDGQPSIREILDGSSCDEILVLDFNNDVFKQIYHVEGKYFVPLIDTLSIKDLIQFALDHIVNPEDRETYRELMEPKSLLERLKNSKTPNFLFSQFRYKLQDGSYRWVEQCLLTGEENGIKPGVVRLYVFDIQNLKSRELGQTLNDHNTIIRDRDLMTGLLSEKPFFVTSQAIVDTNKKKNWVLISIDIEHFKLFDEWYGRETGNNLLAKIGKVLLDKKHTGVACAGYFGQDDFGVLIEKDSRKIENLYERIRKVILSFGLAIGFMPAFGVAAIEDEALIVDAFDKASIAASKAKGDVKNRIHIYSEQMHLLAGNEYKILSDFINALKTGELVFYLQPQCRISTHKIVGAECLARWVKPNGTIIPPNEFIPILEKHGFIIDLDKYLWEKVCIWLRKWLDAGHEAVPISLNVSRADIYTIDIATHFEELTKKYNIPHNLLKIEITESAYMETTDTIGNLVKKLRKMGFLVLMDDFGSGYSSLNMLSNVDLDVIKLDANFLNFKTQTTEKSIHILESVVNMAKILALPIIVEGVETREQTNFLEDMGCRYVQGFFFYKPMPVGAFEALISNPENIDPRGFIAKPNEQFRIREFMDKNIYSDSMLNSILGAAAIYEWKGKNVDIVRYNQQFYEQVNVPDFQEKLVGIQNVMPEEDAQRMYELLKEACENKLSGASGVFRFYRVDGGISSFLIHFFNIGHKGSTERFYGAANNVTEIVDLQQKMDLIAKYSQTSIVFVKRKNDRWYFTVATQGIMKALGLTAQQFEDELNNNVFFKRAVGEKELEKTANIRDILVKSKKDFTFSTKIRSEFKKILDVTFIFRYVNDITNNIDYLFTVRIDGASD